MDLLRTGIQFIFFNTAYQLHAARSTETLKKAQTFLLLPDLLNFYFSGVQSCDVTNASTTQLLERTFTRVGIGSLIDKLDEIPKKIFPLHSINQEKKIGDISGHGPLDWDFGCRRSLAHMTLHLPLAGVPLKSDRTSAYLLAAPGRRWASNSTPLLH
jgi:rhamnulokinase